MNQLRKPHTNVRHVVRKSHL